MKKKPEEMTSEEIMEELNKLNREIERLTPKVLGNLISMNKQLHALMKNETGREALMESLRTDEGLRKTLLEYTSVMENLKKKLLEFEDVISSKVAELRKKQ
ncbi:MAG: hypothetical protein JSV57_01570 [Candidatus Bathyarchaeota archaeon]|nr:MAG: hypothetical protein JSV57_01570 [Candidatus Bathyarchaeota archaeon]